MDRTSRIYFIFYLMIKLRAFLDLNANESEARSLLTRMRDKELFDLGVLPDTVRILYTNVFKLQT